MVYSLFFYLLVLGVAGAVVAVSVRLDRSRFGRAWVALREDEIAAQSVGISLIKTKMLAFATGAAFSGGMGAIFAAKQLFVSPDSFTFIQSITILVMVLLGGMGSIRGAVLGAAAVTLLNIEVLKNFSDFLNGLRQSGFVLNLGAFRYSFADLPTQLEPAKYERMIFGLIIILMTIFRPSGLIPERRHRLELDGVARDRDGAGRATEGGT
jgi:branched-chain amino acid transport system permease protein